MKTQRKIAAYATILEPGKGQVAALYVLLGVAVLAFFAGSSYLRIVDTFHARDRLAKRNAPSQDGLYYTSWCSKELKVCETRLHSCGEQPAGCERLLDECRHVALRCQRASETLEADIPQSWLSQLSEEWDARSKAHGLGNRPAKPEEDCGKHGYLGMDGKCHCAIMYAGRDCQYGFVLHWILRTYFDKAYKLKPQKRTFNGEYWGSYTLSQESRFGGSSPGPQNWMGQEIKLQLRYRDLRTGQNYKDVKYLGRADQSLFKALPETDEVGKEVYDRCAVVGSSGVLLNFQQGKEIDAHDMVMRFNGAPVKGFEKHVGSFTTMRLVTTPFLAFNEAGETVLHSPMSEQVLGAYKARRKFNSLRESAPLYLLDPDFVTWQQSVVMEWKPTIAWTGIMLAMQICRRVDLYGLLVSEAHGSPYHYHDTCASPAPLRSKEEADTREWSLLLSFKQSRMLHFMEPCVVECRVSTEFCLACRRRAPGWNDTIPAEVDSLRRQRKRLTPSYCKKADLHHAVEEVLEGGNSTVEVPKYAEDWSRITRPPLPGQADAERFDPLAG